MKFPARAGKMTLVYPKWIPGDHAPDGPIADVSGISLTCNSQPLAWRRDALDLFTFVCNVPEGANCVEADLDYFSPGDGSGIATSGIAVIDWHLFLLYPEGEPANAQEVEASIVLPDGWKPMGTLRVAGSEGATTRFAPTTLEMLIDHPVLAGAHVREIPLGDEPPSRLCVAADRAEALSVDEGFVTSCGRLDRELGALFRARPYRAYDLLVALSDHMDFEGLEHHECSDNRLGEKGLSDPDQIRRSAATLLSHEWFHSWNGKFKRPSGLATRDYQEPMRTELLWVYEGLTEHYGNVLAVRMGAWDERTYLEYQANQVAMLGAGTGRSWRSVGDTAECAQVLYGTRHDFSGDRRGVDFYDEGDVIWGEVDAIIRDRTKGSRSLDDFCRAFFGAVDGDENPEGTPPRVEAYGLEDVCAALNTVCEHDWRAFFEDRVWGVHEGAPVSGIEAAGWRLEFGAEENEWSRGTDAYPRLFLSAGFDLGDDGVVTKVRLNSAAFACGIGPGMKIIAVDGAALNAEVLENAIAHAKERKSPIELLVDNMGAVSTLQLDYHDGSRWPHLVRREGTAELLTAHLRPIAK